MNIQRFLSVAAIAFVSGGIAGAVVARMVTPSVPETRRPVSSTSTAPFPISATSVSPVISLVPVERRAAVPLLPPAFVKRHSSGIGTLYRKPKGASFEERMLGDERAIGRAVSLTSDGWFVTSASVFDGVRLADVVLWHNGTAYAVERGMLDRLTNAIFFHVQAFGLSAPAFAQTREETLGAEVWIEARPNTYAPSIVLDQGGRIAPNDPSSSEVAARRLILDRKASALDRGGAAWDPNGSLVGIVESKTGEDVRLISASAIASSFSSLLENGEIRHAFLGIRAIDLGTAAFDGPRDGLPLQGALVRDDKKAVKAALKNGDVILRVERDILDGTVDLGEILSEYHPGTTVTLHVFRAAVDTNVPVVLGSVVTSEALK